MSAINLFSEETLFSTFNSIEKYRQSYVTLLVRLLYLRMNLEFFHIYTQKSFRNLIKSNRNQIIFTIFGLIWNQTEVRLVPNQSENGKIKISRRLLCVYVKKCTCRTNAVKTTSA